MPDSPRHPSFSFHIEDRESDSHTVSANVLAVILQRAQHAFELIGVHLEGRDIRSRARIPAAVSERFQLICELPAEGSYAMPVTVGGTTGLFDPEQASRAFNIFRDVSEAVAARDEARIVAQLPNSRIRRRVLESIRGMAPPAESRWRLTLHDESDRVFATLDADAARFIDETLVPAEQREAARVVTGELKSIDFAEHKVTIIYPPTSKELACIYDEDIEELLYERRRDFIQVTGRVVLDDAGEPKQIIDVTDIRDLDLSVFVIDSVPLRSGQLRAVAALVLEPVLDETKQLLCVQDTGVGLDAFAHTREKLLIEINEQLAMLWQEYALASDDELSDRARTMKATLLATFTEVGHAAQTA